MRFRRSWPSLVVGMLAVHRVFGSPPSPAAPHLVLQTGPEASVTSVAVSPDGRHVATSSFDGRIRVHDARTGDLRLALGSNVDRGGRIVAFLPDGRGLTAAGFHMDKRVKVWDLTTGAPVRTLAGHSEIETYAVAVSPDGRLLASAGTDRLILVWELATGTLRHRFAEQPLPVTALAFSPDSLTLASGGGEKTVRLWSMETGRLRSALEGHRDWISTLVFSPDGATLASGSCDWAYHRGRDPSRFEGRDPGAQSEWKLWEVANGRLKRSVTEPDRLLSLAFAPDSAALVCGIGRDARLYDLRTEHPGRVVMRHDGPITGIAFAPDGDSLYTTSHDRTVRRTALVSGKELWCVPGSWEQVNAVAISPDGALIATGSSDLRFAERTHGPASGPLGPGAVRLWDARTGRLIRRLGESCEQVLAVAFSPDGRRIAGAGGRDHDKSGFLHVWKSNGGEPVWSLDDQKSIVRALAFAPDHSALACAGADGAITLRHPDSGAIVRTLEGHEGELTSVHFAADRRLVVAGGVNGAASLWDYHDGHRLQRFRPPGVLERIVTGGERTVISVALSRDGQTLATGSASVGPQFGDQVVRIWDVSTGTLKRELCNTQTNCRFILISPDGTILATNGVGKSITLWDLRTGTQLRSLVAHAHPPQGASFSPDGRLLASGGDFRTTNVWDVASGRLVATLRTFVESRSGIAADGWLAFGPEGFYHGSPGLDRFLAWRVGDDLKRPDSLRASLHRPDRIEAALTGAVSDPGDKPGP